MMDYKKTKCKQLYVVKIANDWLSLTLLSTDEEVITACRMYLRGACGDSLDSMQGSNYQVISVAKTS